MKRILFFPEETDCSKYLSIPAMHKDIFACLCNVPWELDFVLWCSSKPNSLSELHFKCHISIIFKGRDHRGSVQIEARFKEAQRKKSKARSYGSFSKQKYSGLSPYIFWLLIFFSFLHYGYSSFPHSMFMLDMDQYQPCDKQKSKWIKVIVSCTPGQQHLQSCPSLGHN